MTVHRRIATLARRQPSSKLELFWHGTSNLSLRSILLYGLNPAKIKIGNWLTDRTVNEINPSKVSYGGIYFARSMFTAYTYGTDISRSHPGSRPLLIATMLQELAAVPDEDSLALHSVFISFVNQSEVSAAEVLVNLLARVELRSYNGKYTWRSYIDRFRQQVLERTGVTTEQINRRQDKARVWGALDAMLLALCRRYLAHIQNRKSYQNGDYYIRKAVWDYAPRLAKQYTVETPAGTTLKLPTKYRLPPPEQAERDVAKAIEYFIQLVRHPVIKLHRQGDTWRQNNRTIRTMQTVGFRGRNRIICIMELVDETGRYFKRDVEHIKIHYGKVPPEFLEQYRERISGRMPIIWLDKSGKEIGRDTPPTSLASRLLELQD